MFTQFSQTHSCLRKGYMGDRELQPSHEPVLFELEIRYICKVIVFDNLTGGHLDQECHLLW